VAEHFGRIGAGSDAINAFRTRADQLLDSVQRDEHLTRSTDHAER
jgi:hypothetical protein